MKRSRDSKRTSRGKNSAESDSKGAQPEDDQETDEGLETFYQRANWWRDYHGDASSVISGESRLQAITHAEKIAANGLDNPDPGGDRPRRGFELLAKRGTKKVKAKRGKNPRPASSFGFASDAIEVRGPFELNGVVLKIALDEKQTKKIDPSTVRVFLYDENSLEWQYIPRSGARGDAGYAWAHLHRPGLYVAIGLPASGAGLSVILMLRSLMPRLRSSVDAAGRRHALELIAQLLFPKDDAKKRADTGIGLRSVARLEMHGRGIPEFEILDEFCLPRSSGNQLGMETINRLRWDDILGDPGGSSIFYEPWRSVGPRNFSGRIKSLSIHPVEGSGLLAGAANGGVWRTEDNGGTWLPLMGQELSLAIGAVARSGADLKVIYAATGEDTPGYGPSYPGVGVYKSGDGGATWQLLAPINSRLCTRVLIHPNNADIVYVAGNAGLHKSIDGGNSWTNVRTDHVCDLVMDPSSPERIYAAVWNSGIFVTGDGGSSWADFNEGLPTGNAAEWIKLAVTDVHGAAGQQRFITLVAKMGVDSGKLFTRRISIPAGTAPPPAWKALLGTHAPATYNEWTNFAAIGPRRPEVIFAGGVGLKRSVDFGATFSKITGTHSDHHALVFARLNTNLCYMATDGGVYRSIDEGASWTLCSTGLVATQLYSIGVSQAGAFVLGGATQDQGIIKTTGPADWSNTKAGNEGGFFIVDPRNSKNVFANPWSTNLRRSVDGGNHWKTILNGIPQTGMPPKTVRVRHVAVNPLDSNLLLCVAGDQIFRSINRGDNWVSVFTFPAETFPVRVVWYGDKTCYATTRNGLVVRSTRQGKANSWSKPYNEASKPPFGVIVALEARMVGSVFSPALAPSTRRSALAGEVGFPFETDLVYIAYSSGMVYKSIDGGAHWVNASGSGSTLPFTPISGLVIDRHHSDTVYVATDIGVFRTRDGGANWLPFNDELPRVVVSGIVLHGATNRLYVSTMGRGAFSRQL